MKKFIFRIMLLFAIIWISPTPATGDWINLSGAENAPNIAEIHITEKSVRVELEIFVNDIVAFDNLIPDTFFKGSDIKRPPVAQRLRRFSEQDLQIVDDRGQTLQADLIRAEPRFRTERPSPFAGKLNPYTRQIIPGPPKDKRVLYVELVYSLSHRPKSLTLTPPRDDSGFVRASIGFITYHNGVPIIDFREENDVYDRLASSVTGDLLADIYIQNRKSLVVTQAGEPGPG
jgi:hypothetical protein